MRYLLTLALIFTVTACGGDEPDTENNSTSANNTSTSTSANNTSTSVNNTATSANNVTPPEPTGSIELIYDDDVADYGFAPLGLDNRVLAQAEVAQLFYPPADGELETVEIVIGSPNKPTAPFELMIYENDEGNPGAPLLDEPMTLRADDGTHFEASFSVTSATTGFSDLPVTRDGFFVSFKYLDTEPENVPSLAMDRHNMDQANRARIMFEGESWQPLLDGLPEQAQATPMMRATVRVPEATVPEAPVLVSNAPRDCRHYLAGRLPDDQINQWSAARLSPPSTPFEVTAVRYELRHGPNDDGADCSAALPHRVWVFVSEGAPMQSPVPVAEFDVELRETGLLGEMTPVMLELDTPVTLENGEFLYVAVEMPGDSPRTCVGVCRDHYELEENWLSGSLEPPFSWTNFDVLEVDLSATHRAYGNVVN